ESAGGAGGPDAEGHGVDQGLKAELAPALHGLALVAAEDLRLAADDLFLAEELDEDKGLGSEDVGVDGLEDVVDGAGLVAFEDEGPVTAAGGDEEDGDVAVSFALLDELDGLD